MWHVFAAIGVYWLGVLSNVIACVIQRVLHRRYHWWWIEP